MEVSFPIAPPIISELLKKATSSHDTGEYNQAIEYLKQAYQEIAKTSISYSTQTFLRLPLYLQKAKRKEEAWSEFNNFLKNGYPNQSTEEDLIAFNHSKIYDKMRLFLQRKGENIRAVKYGIFSYLSLLIGYYKQIDYFKHSKKKYERKFAKLPRERLKIYSTKDLIIKTLLPLLKKAKKQELLKDLIDFIESHMKRLSYINITDLNNELNKILQLKNSPVN